jgi:hypothetical protein
VLTCCKIDGYQNFCASNNDCCAGNCGTQFNQGTCCTVSGGDCNLSDPGTCCGATFYTKGLGNSEGFASSRVSYSSRVYKHQLHSMALVRIGVNLGERGLLPPSGAVSKEHFKALEKLQGLIGVVEKKDEGLVLQIMVISSHNHSHRKRRRRGVQMITSRIYNSR